jgi:hypothetical protein
MCIGAVVTWPGGGGGGRGCVDALCEGGCRIDPGGGGGAERSDCDGGGPDLNCAEGGADPFDRG